MLVERKSLIKWIGGKAKSKDIIFQKFPERIKRYAEPFLGSGTMLYHVLCNYKIEESVASDANFQLINFHIQVRDNYHELEASCREIAAKYNNFKFYFDRENFFYHARDTFNWNKKKTGVNMAALFHFINKTSHNGLYRENKLGKYNAPWGKDKEKYIVPSLEDFYMVSRLTKRTEFLWCDFNEFPVLENPSKDTLYYFDPPYRPLNDKKRDEYYTQLGFSDKEQESLKLFADNRFSEGANVYISNSGDKNREYFGNLYNGYNIESVPVYRGVNPKGGERGLVEELLIYKKH